MSKKTEPWKLEKAKQLLQDGLTKAEIRERLGISTSVLQQVRRALEGGPRTD